MGCAAPIGCASRVAAGVKMYFSIAARQCDVCGMPVLAGDGHQHTGWVLAYDERRGQHQVLYDDAEEEWVHLPTDATSWAAGPPSCPTHGGLPPGAIFSDTAFRILLSLLPVPVTSIMLVVDRAAGCHKH